MSERTLWKYEATIVYFLAGIGLFYGVSILISDFQDFSHLAAILPPIVAYCLPAYLFLILHWQANATSFARLRLTRRLNGLILAAIGLAGAIIVVLYVAIDVYHGFFQGYISPLFPFDVFAIYLAALLIGSYLAYKSFRMKDPSRHEYANRIGGRLNQGLGDFFRPLYFVFALYDAGAILMGLVSNNSLIVNAATCDAKDVLVAVEPSSYSSIEGEDIADQEQNIGMHQTMRAAMSNMIPLVEGFPGVVMVAPIFDGNGQFIGALSIVIYPNAVIAPIAEEKINGTPYAMWAMQTNGTLIYDPDPQQQGKNLFTDPAYAGYTSVQAFAHDVAAQRSGYGSYQYYNSNLDNSQKQVVNKEAYWATIGIYGTEWRLVITHVTNP